MKKNFKFLLVILPFAFLVLPLLSGCATLTEGTKGFAGISTKVLEEGRKNAVSKIINCDYNACYHQAKEILKSIGAYIYSADPKKQLIAVYVSDEDTTPVGLFFQEIDANNTLIEVSSPSSYAKELIAEKVSAAFKELKEPKEKKE